MLNIDSQNNDIVFVNLDMKNDVKRYDRSLW